MRERREYRNFKPNLWSNRKSPGISRKRKKSEKYRNGIKSETEVFLLSCFLMKRGLLEKYFFCTNLIISSSSVLPCWIRGEAQEINTINASNLFVGLAC